MQTQACFNKQTFTLNPDLAQIRYNNKTLQKLSQTGEAAVKVPDLLFGRTVYASSYYGGYISSSFTSEFTNLTTKNVKD